MTRPEEIKGIKNTKKFIQLLVTEKQKKLVDDLATAHGCDHTDVLRAGVTLLMKIDALRKATSEGRFPAQTDTALLLNILTPWFEPEIKSPIDPQL